MPKQSINTLKNWFKKGLKPLESQFADWLDSFWHKDATDIPITSIDGLEDQLNNKVSIEAINALEEAKEDKANKGQPDGYASLDESGKVPSTQLPSYVPANATESVKGIAQIASELDVLTGSDHSKIITPHGLQYRIKRLPVCEFSADCVSSIDLNLNGIGQVIQGYEVVEGSIVIVNAQSDVTENGIYYARDVEDWLKIGADYFNDQLNYTGNFVGLMIFNRADQHMYQQKTVLSDIESEGLKFHPVGIKLTDTQTISAEWIFTESPVVPTPESGDNSEKAANTQWVRENTLAITEDEQAAIPAGETNLFTVSKSIDGTEITYGAGVRQIDNFANSGLSSLLADDAPWVGDAITLEGDNREGQLGQTAQEFVISNYTGTMYKCVSHVTGVTSSDGSATWIRTRSKDNLDETADEDIITALTNESGWSSNVKVITVRCKVGSWYTSIAGYTYFCFEEVAGTSWSWRRIGEPDAIPVQITDEDLIEEIEAHDFGTTAMLVPSSTVKGEDRQQHFWVTGGTVPNLAMCIDVSGEKTWIKIK